MLVYISITCFCYLLLFMGRMAPPVKVKGPTKQLGHRENNQYIDTY